MSSPQANAQFLRDLAQRKRGKVLAMRLDLAQTHPWSKAAKRVKRELKRAEIDAGLAQGRAMEAQREVIEREGLAEPKFIVDEAGNTGWVIP